MTLDELIDNCRVSLLCRSLEIDIDAVPQGVRKLDEFKRFYDEMSRALKDPRQVATTCVHEGGHAFYLEATGFKSITITGPAITFDGQKNTLAGWLAFVAGAEDSKNEQYLATLTAEQLRDRAAKSFAAGGVAARVLAQSHDTFGDAKDRELFDAWYDACHAMPDIVLPEANELWREAGKSTETDLTNPNIVARILALADIIREQLFKKNAS